jgi:indole-3-glycerol phosphate synthase
MMQRSIYAILCIWYILNVVNSFIVKNTIRPMTIDRNIGKHQPQRVLSMSTSASTIIRKNKLKEVEALKANVTAQPDHVINRYLNTGEQLYGVSNPVPFTKSILNRYNTVSVMAEHNKKARTGFILGLPPPEIMGGLLRDAGAKAIIVSLDKRFGGSTTEEFYRLCKEQNQARLFTPGPIPIVWNDYLVDDIQIVYAAALGAAAVTLDLEVLADDLQQKVETCKKYKLEPIALIKSLEEGNAAIAAGVKVLCLRNMNAQGFLDLRSQLPNSTDLVYIARLRAEVDFSIYTEIDIAWLLRDYGFHCVWPSPEALYATTVSDIYANVMALKAKASREFLSPRQFLMDRNKEGAKEFLGNIYF